jgi:hypothetical protein
MFEEPTSTTIARITHWKAERPALTAKLDHFLRDHRLHFLPWEKHRRRSFNADVSFAVRRGNQERQFS